jgi:putative lipoprotein
MTLPPDAVFEATLEDVSGADAPSTSLGEARMEQLGNPPFRFAIQYDPTQIVPNHTYVVRVRISVGEQLLFTTDQRYQVLTQGHGSEIGVMMLKRVSGTAGGDAAARIPLRGTYWKLVQLEEKPVTSADTQQEANLVFHSDGGRVTGSGGCNRLTGSYAADGSAMHFNGVASTRMACSHGMEVEMRFLGTLEHVRSWKISGQQLDLLDDGGKMLARFSAGTMKSK